MWQDGLSYSQGGCMSATLCIEHRVAGFFCARWATQEYDNIVIEA